MSMASTDKIPKLLDHGMFSVGPKESELGRSETGTTENGISALMREYKNSQIDDKCQYGQTKNNAGPQQYYNIWQ